MDYPADIVRLAADPRTGVVAAFPNGLPNVGQIKVHLDDKLSHRDKLALLAALPKVEKQTYFPRPAPEAGDLANVFVPIGTPMYAHMVEKAKTGNPREFRYERGREGIFVALGWIDDPHGNTAKKLKQISLTDDDLRKLYPSKPDSEEAAA